MVAGESPFGFNMGNVHVPLCLFLLLDLFCFSLSHGTKINYKSLYSNSLKSSLRRIHTLTNVFHKTFYSRFLVEREFYKIYTYPSGLECLKFYVSFVFANVPKTRRNNTASVMILLNPLSQLANLGYIINTIKSLCFSVWLKNLTTSPISIGSSYYVPLYLSCFFCQVIQEECFSFHRYTQPSTSISFTSYSLPQWLIRQLQIYCSPNHSPFLILTIIVYLFETQFYNISRYFSELPKLSSSFIFDQNHCKKGIVIFNLNPMSQHQKNLSGRMTVLSIVNGMIGGLILLLPVMALQTGWLLTLIILVMTGLMSYYSCYLCVIHTGSEPDLDTAIQKHFWNSRRVKIFYEVCIWLNLMLILTLYFQLIVLQWVGLAPPHHYTKTNALINALVILALVFLIKYRDFGANLMAYGIISIISYLVFITWVAASEDTSSKEVEFKAIGKNGIQLTAALAQAYAIQSFFIPVLKKNNKTNQHQRYLLLSFVLGGLAYAFIAFVGSYGILYREYKLDKSDSSITIEGYFEMSNWEVNAIEIIYLIHLYSVFPQYLLIGKRRFFSIFQLEETESRNINKYEIVYVFAVITYCLIMALNQISIREIIDLNGAILGFFFIYFFPLALHFKCKYFEAKPQTVELVKKEAQNYAQMNEENEANKQVNVEQKQKPLQLKQLEIKENVQQNKEQAVNSQKREGQIALKNDSQPGNEYQTQKQVKLDCRCKGKASSKREKVAQITVMSIMLLLGGFTLFDGIAQLFRD